MFVYSDVCGFAKRLILFPLKHFTKLELYALIKLHKTILKMCFSPQSSFLMATKSISRDKLNKCLSFKDKAQRPTPPF